MFGAAYSALAAPERIHSGGGLDVFLSFHNLQSAIHNRESEGCLVALAVFKTVVDLAHAGSG